MIKLLDGKPDRSVSTLPAQRAIETVTRCPHTACVPGRSSCGFVGLLPHSAINKYILEGKAFDGRESTAL